MKPVDVLYFIEHVARELDVALIVKALVEAKSPHKVVIKHIYGDAKEAMKTFRPKVVVVPFFYSRDDLGMKEFIRIWPSALFFNLAWEQIFYPLQQKLKKPKDSFTKNHIFHHAWAPFYKKYLLENGVGEDKIFLNGNPIYELYQNPYKLFFTNRQILSRKYHLDKKKKWIFIPENYRWAFETDKRLQRVSGDGISTTSLFSLRDFSQRSLRLLLEWLERLSYEEDIEVILRPRPATAKTLLLHFYNKNSGKSSTRIHIIKKESVREWVLASDIVLSSFSTTLIEGAVANKPIYIFEPIRFPKIVSNSWYRYVEKIKSYRSLQKMCRGEGSVSGKKLKMWAYTTMFQTHDPIEKLTNFIQNLLDNPRVDNVSFPKKADALYTYVQNRFLPKTYFNPDTHDSDLFSDSEIDAKLNRWKSILLPN
ncbi:hypothetical protein HYW55_03220 [Candidatus Gottesmanbacteria bacterium]|nr:hypothetical protein [Candidatus Gottesmanbacteria bacterium]